ncbi:MAG: enoyl-CoA hydratase/isomerase family protein, partial [Candidatus Thermoplasmatota archaeon]|nr:enoyl-CoA hydratase/isomerase family protein [Candidatus Thermoplasmatota archaeon]
MSDLYGLKLEPMPNRLVNYGVTENGIAVIELTSDSAGAPLEGPNDRSPNTYTHGMMRDIDEAIVRARFDDSVTCIVLTGNGASFFSAGASIQMLNSVSPGFKYNFCLHANETLSRLEQTAKLVVCAINGHAVGGGLEIAMAADIRIARKNSGKVGLPEINLGVLAGTGGTARLTRLIGKAKALEMMVTGELMSFEDAHACNLINHIWEGDPDDFRRDIL